MNKNSRRGGGMVSPEYSDSEGDDDYFKNAIGGSTALLFGPQE
jgi:hypothetical protein